MAAASRTLHGSESPAEAELFPTCGRILDAIRGKNQRRLPDRGEQSVAVRGEREQSVENTPVYNPCDTDIIEQPNAMEVSLYGSPFRPGMLQK